MAKCTKCSAELLRAAKFCAACGAAVSLPAAEEQGPNTVSGLAPTASAKPVVVPTPGSAVNPFATTGDASSQVNPFAATASPNSAAQVEAARGSAPEVTTARDPSEASATSDEPAPAISPLAVSNALAPDSAFKQAIESAKERARLSQPPPNAKKPGTQVMQHVPSRRGPVTAPPAEATAQAKPRTVAMNVNLGLGSAYPPRPAHPASQRAPGSLQQPHPPNVNAGYSATPGYSAAPQAAPAVHPHGARWGWNAPMMAPQPAPPPVHAAPYAAAPHGFAYAPGARVRVTWSNGQRYPATVHQVSGGSCLVVFPDGQQHWVEMQYLSPG